MSNEDFIRSNDIEEADLKTVYKLKKLKPVEVIISLYNISYFKS